MNQPTMIDPTGEDRRRRKAAAQSATHDGLFDDDPATIRKAWHTASEAADRFRDVVSEVLGLTENPGDDELVRLLRERHGQSGPESRRWRDFLDGQLDWLTS